MKAVPELAKHLQEHHNFKLVLSGKLMSNLIERRLGWYKQVNGAIFPSRLNSCCWQKKIYCLGLLQQHMISNAANLEHLPLLSQKDIASIDAEQRE